MYRKAKSTGGRKMNQKDLRLEILKYLEKNSRVDLGELAVLLGVTEVDVANAMSNMEQEKIICGYNTLIDWDKAGVEKVTALIEVRVTPQRNRGFDRIAERIYNYPEVFLSLIHIYQSEQREYKRQEDGILFCRPGNL